MAIRLKKVGFGLLLAGMLCGSAEGGELDFVPRERAGVVSAKVRDNCYEVTIGTKNWVSFIPKQSETWDLSKSRFLVFDMKNQDAENSVQFILNIRQQSPGSSRHPHLGRLGLGILRPGEEKTFRFRIPHEGTETFDCLMKNAYFLPDGIPSAMKVNEWETAGIGMQLSPGKCEIGNFRLEGDYAPDPVYLSADRFFPLLDRYGQNRHEEWEGKISRDEDFQARHRDELQSLSPRIASWNKWGGWADGPTLEKTGFFRTEKYRGKWYLVDPDGKLFFSAGINAMSAFAGWTETANRARLFEEKPPLPGQICFYTGNLKRKFGDGFPDRFYDFLQLRMDSWGVNTIGNWSDDRLQRQKKRAYTAELRFPLKKYPRLGKVFDPFSAEFAEAMDDMFQDARVDYMGDKPREFKYMANDPWCIGIYINNEIPWENVAVDTLKAPASQPAKRALVEFLREKYRGNIERLNFFWDTKYGTWDAFAESQSVPRANFYVSRDCEGFSEYFAEQYFRLCRQAVKKFAPNNLYLGSRFIWSDPDREWLNRAAARYMDIVAYNYYGFSYDDFAPKGLGDKPVLITETTVGATRRGSFGALDGVGANPGERGETLIRKMETLIRHPLIVGVHHFEMVDQPLTGRRDGENFSFGFVDITDTPDQEFAAAHRRVVEEMYLRRSDERK